MDREGQPLVAIVNEEFVKEFFPHSNPDRRSHRLDKSARTTAVDDYRRCCRRRETFRTQPAGRSRRVRPLFAVRRALAALDDSGHSHFGSGAGLVDEVKQQVWGVDRQIPLSDIHSMVELMAVSLDQERFNMSLLGIFAALALILATVGIYGLMAYTVSQRTHEIGVRVAIGAQRRDVLSLVVREGAKLAFLGIAIGIAAALRTDQVDG